MKNITINKLDLTVSLYIFGVITAELLGIKAFTFDVLNWFQVNVTVAIFVMPLLFTMVDSVIEVYGRQRARSMVYSGLIIVVLLILYAALTTHLKTAQRFASTESAYVQVFDSSIRFSVASLAAFASSEILDVIIFSRLREKLKGRALWLRNNLTNFVAQFADSTVFVALAFYAIHESFGANWSFLVSVAIPYWLVRCVLSIFETPLVYLGVWWLRGSSDPRARISI